MARRTKILSIALIAVVALAAARELGLVELDLQRSESTWTRTGSIRNEERLADADLRIEYLDGDLRHVHHVSRGKERTIDVTARRTRFDLTGWTWTPLFKRAGVEFAVEVTSSDPEVAGSFSGHLEKESLGLVARRSFVAGLHDEVRRQALAALAP